MAWTTQDIKLRELILYVSKESENDPKFGSIKLNKILFYADFLAYLKRGRSITDQEYFALDEGPAPKRMKPITEKMKCNHWLSYQIIELGRYRQKKPIALRPPDYSKFDAEDISITNDVIKRLRNMNGREVSDMSHRFAGYIAAFAQGEKTTIHYSMVQFDPETFWGVETPPLSQKLISYGKELAKKLAKTSQPASA